MHRIYLSLLLAALLLHAAARAARVEHGSLTYDNIPEVSAQLAEKVDAYSNARQAIPLGWSPKGQVLIATRFGDVPQLHLLEQAGGARRQLTFERDRIDQAAFSPDPARTAYAYLKDIGGNENWQLYYQALGEPAKLLTDGKSRNGALRWSNNGRELAFYSTARDGRSFDIDVVDPDSGALPRLLLSADPDGAEWLVTDWSPDDGKLLVLKRVSSTESYLYVVDLSSGQKHEVEPTPTKVSIVNAKFSRDAQGVYLISDRESEFARLRYVNLFGNEKSSVISAQIPWDIEDLALSRDGRYLAYVSNEGGASKLNLLDLRSRQDLIAPHLPGSGIVDGLSFDPTGKRLLFGFSAPQQPEDAYVLDVAENRLQPWTRSEIGALNPAKFVTPRLVQFPTFDRVDGKQRLEPAYIYQPVGAGPHPVLLDLHGGPESQQRPAFRAWYQFVVNELGFAVVAPNVRGSTGYGKSYSALDNGVLREDAVKDVGALLVWLGLQAEFDAKHVVVAGASYGGYLSLATLVNYSDRLRGGVDCAGVSDFVSFLTNTAPYRQNLRRAEYGDERDPEMRSFLRRISPLTNAERITKPLLVIHGKNDPRVPLSEAEQIVNRLRARGQEVWYLTAADEGHGYGKKQNRDAMLKVFAQFLSNLRQ